MTKDVLVSIAGYQFDVNEDDAIELITTGEYYKKNEKHYVLYEEHLMEDDAVTKNIMKIGNGKIELVKRGSGNMTMIFEKGRMNYSNYQTPFGEMMVGVTTDHLSVEEQEDEMQIRILYHLEVNGELISRCEIKMKIESKQP